MKIQAIIPAMILAALLLSGHTARAQWPEPCLEASDFHDRGLKAEALSLYNVCLSHSLTPAQRATVLFNTGNIRLYTNDPDGALIDLKEAIKLQPGDYQALDAMGKAYVLKNDLPRAVEYFSKAIVLNPRYAKAWGNRAVAYKSLGQMELAKRDARQALALDPNVKVPVFLPDSDTEPLPDTPSTEAIRPVDQAAPAQPQPAPPAQAEPPTIHDAPPTISPAPYESSICATTPECAQYIAGLANGPVTIQQDRAQQDLAINGSTVHHHFSAVGENCQGDALPFEETNTFDLKLLRGAFARPAPYHEVTLLFEGHVVTSTRTCETCSTRERTAQLATITVGVVDPEYADDLAEAFKKLSTLLGARLYE